MTIDRSSILEEIGYLKVCLDKARTLGVDEETKTDDSKYTALGEVVMYFHLNMGPTVEFSPQNLGNISHIDCGALFGYASRSIAELGYVGKLNTEENFLDDGSRNVNLTFQKEKTPTYAIQMDGECIRLHSEDGINILQEMWMRCR